MTEIVSGVAETATTTTTTSTTTSTTATTEERVRMVHEDIVTNQDSSEERKELRLKQHYMRVDVDLIKGVLEEVIVNTVEKKGEEDEERRISSKKEDWWLRKWYKRMG